MALRGWRGTFSRISQEFVARPEIDDTLNLLPLGSAFEPLTLPAHEKPLLSIIIPVYGKLEYTLACLSSIVANPPTDAFEVIVVDDASPDDSAEALAKIQGIRLLHNASNLGFVGSCNAGASSAQGQFLIFLNNDTQVLPGWSEELIHCFELRDDCGIAGSQLVYPDGRLQEAGAWVFADASAWNIGRFESRSDPAVRYARQVDYVSGASLAIRSRLFNQLGGFDLRFAPGYYEDTDLAFAARAAGHSIWYVPTSVVVHAEGISSSSTETGMKRFQVINQAKFADKWKEALAAQPQAGTALALVAKSRRRGTILVVDMATPDASRDSGSLRLISIMRLLVEDGWHVVFAPDDGRADDAAIRELGSFGIEVIARPWADGVPSWLARSSGDLHAAILSRHMVASQYTRLIRQHAPGARVIFDTVDLHFLREERAAHRARSASMVRQAETTRAQELALIAQADTTFVVSAYERDLLKQLIPSASVDLLSNIHDVFGRTAGHAGRRDLLFVGGFAHPPNADAMNWMASEILPALRRLIPDANILVAGDVPEGNRRLLAEAGLHMLGRVPDLEPLMSAALASIAPLRFGAGVKGKINMAMSHGVPVIGTAMAVEGMHLEDGLDVLVADTAEAFASAYARLVRDQALWYLLSDGALVNVRTHFSAEAARDALRRAIL